MKNFERGFTRISLVQMLVVFLALTGAVTILINVFQIPFGNENYFNHHGFLFLIFITFFPRLTLFFSSVPFGGLLWWIGFFLAPRLLVAVLATLNYWHQNPILVTIAWIVALGGESTEKVVLTRRSRARTPEDLPRYNQSFRRDSTAKTIDAEFVVKE